MSAVVGSERHLKGDERTPSGRPDSTSEHKIYTIHSTAHTHSTGRPEPLILKLDERQRLARERREEKERQTAAREVQWQERAERSRQYYEKQLEEKRRRMEEQRQKEERRRAQVEEKRLQKLQEEKARYEAVMRKTLEKSQKVRPKANRWSWGGILTPSISHNSDADRRSVSTMNLSKHTDPVITKRLSSSSATLINSTDRALQKRTSMSSSCLVNKAPSKAPMSREKTQQDKAAGMHRMPLVLWENTVVSRLQAPTHSYLARSRSAVSLSGDAASCHPMSSQSFKSLHSRSAERPIRAGLNFERPVRAGNVGLDTPARRKTVHNMPMERKDKDYVRKSWSNLSYPTPFLTPNTRTSPSNQGNRASHPLAVRSSAKPPQKPLMSRKSRSPPPPASLPLSLGNPSLTSSNLRPNREEPESGGPALEDKRDAKKEKGAKIEAGGTKEDETQREEVESRREEEETQREAEGTRQEEVQQHASPTKAPEEVSAAKAEAAIESPVSPPSARPSVGTTDPEEASRLLAEKRRQAREQREQEEEQRRRQEEAERRHREEMARRKAEERARREVEEEQRLAEEEKLEEEERRRSEQEKLQREREEAQRLQRQKEEEEVRQREEAERLRKERESHFRKEEAERLERKKRLEEIMKRTRRSEQKSAGQRNGELSQPGGQDAVSPPPGITPETPQHSDKNGHTNPSLASHPLPPAGHGSVNPEPQLKENGIMDAQVFEDVIQVPLVTKLSRQEADGEEEDERRKAPLLAFQENGNLTATDGQPKHQAHV